LLSPFVFLFFKNTNPFTLNLIEIRKVLKFGNISVKVIAIENNEFILKHKLIIMSNDEAVSGITSLILDLLRNSPMQYATFSIFRSVVYVH